MIDFILALMQDMILSAIPALGFAMVFNVPIGRSPWCALLGALGHGSRMVMMTAGFNIEWSTFYGVAAGRLHWDPVVALVSGASESLHRRGSDPHVSGISAYTAMISAVKIGHFGYSEVLMITLLTNFLKASSIVGALSIGLSVPGLWLYRKRPRV